MIATADAAVEPAELSSAGRAAAASLSGELRATARELATLYDAAARQAAGPLASGLDELARAKREQLAAIERLARALGAAADRPSTPGPGGADLGAHPRLYAASSPRPFRGSGRSRSPAASWARCWRTPTRRGSGRWPRRRPATGLGCTTSTGSTRSVAWP